MRTAESGEQITVAELPYLDETDMKTSLLACLNMYFNLFISVIWM